MEINEIRKEAAILQKHIDHLISDFTAKTGCLVEIYTETTVMSTTDGEPMLRSQDIHTKIIL